MHIFTAYLSKVPFLLYLYLLHGFCKAISSNEFLPTYLSSFVAQIRSMCPAQPILVHQTMAQNANNHTNCESSNCVISSNISVLNPGTNFSESYRHRSKLGGGGQGGEMPPTQYFFNLGIVYLVTELNNGK
jgi:hypothetical protein